MAFSGAGGMKGTTRQPQRIGVMEEGQLSACTEESTIRDFSGNRSARQWSKGGYGDSKVDSQGFGRSRGPNEGARWYS